MQIADLYFHHPWLGLLAFVAGLGALVFATRRWALPRLTPARRIVAWAGIAMAALSLGIFVSDPSTPAPKIGFAWAIVVDRSASAHPAAQVALQKAYQEVLAQAGPEDRVLVVAFNREITVLSRWNSAQDSPADLILARGSAESSGGNLPQAALEYVRASAPRELDLRVILLSDGGGIEDVESLPPKMVLVPLAYQPERDVALRDLQLRSHLRAPDSEGPPCAISGQLEIWSNGPAEATLEIRVEDEEVLSRTLNLTRGLLAYPLEFGVNRAPPFRIEFKISSPADRVLGNEVLAQTVPRQDEQFALLLIDQSADFKESRHLVQALEGSDFELTVMAPSGLPESPDWYDRWNAIIIVDTPATEIDVPRQEAITAWVRGGGGLAMIGSPNTFGAGGWLGSPIERALPVDCDPQSEERGERAFVIVLDVSGSMGSALADGSNKIDHANHGSVITLRMITDEDAFGAIASGSGQKWIVPLAPLEDRGEVETALRSNAAGGGGIYIDAGLRAAMTSLSQSDRKKRYVLIFGDGSDTTLTGADSPADRKAWLDSVTPQLQEAGIAVSCVSIGGGSDTALMRELASRNRGRFFETENASNLPLLFSAAAADMIGGFFQEGLVTISVNNDGDLTRNLPWSEVPPLNGLIATSIKKDATQWLSGSLDSDFPLLATRRFGLGRSLAFTSDATDRWAAEWLGWGGYSRAWQRWMHWLAEGAGWQGSARISLDAQDQLLIDHEDVGNKDVFAFFRGADGSTAEAILDRQSPTASIWRLPRTARQSGRFVFWTQSKSGNGDGERAPIGEASLHRINIDEGWLEHGQAVAFNQFVDARKGMATRTIGPKDASDERLLTSAMLKSELSTRRLRSLWPALVPALAGLFLLLFARRFPAFFRDEGSVKNVSAVATMRRLAAQPRVLPRAAEAEVLKPMHNENAPDTTKSLSGGMDFDRLRRAKEARQRDGE